MLKSFMVHTMSLKQRLEAILKKNGLLCPLLVDKDLNLHNGNHRFKVIKKYGDASIFYKAQTDKKLYI